jgi:hypothetical protein
MANWITKDRFRTDDPEVNAIYEGIDSVLAEYPDVGYRIKKGMRRRLRAVVWRELMDGPPPGEVGESA